MRRAGPEWVAPKKTSNGRESSGIETLFSLQTASSNAGATLSARCGRPTGSDCRSGSGSGSAGCFRRSRRRARWAAVAVALVAAALGAAVGYAIGGWHESVAGGIGGALGAGVVATLVAGTLSRGGTRGGTALLVGLASLVLAALALVPFVGYLEAVALPALGRPRPPAPAERYAGLRSLARD